MKVSELKFFLNTYHDETPIKFIRKFGGEFYLLDAKRGATPGLDNSLYFILDNKEKDELMIRDQQEILIDEKIQPLLDKISNMQIEIDTLKQVIFACTCALQQEDE